MHKTLAHHAGSPQNPNTQLIHCFSLPPQTDPPTLSVRPPTHGSPLSRPRQDSERCKTLALGGFRTVASTQYFIRSAWRSPDAAGSVGQAGTVEIGKSEKCPDATDRKMK
jgi:hypothetical protein